ncbi:cyclic nucleotide-binding domain-containing protein [Puteibacter caeruleilacunae]|nr:cyclic nucleotide-binding domain-containing protein [Puteibacter caeruleilacunae]
MSSQYNKLHTAWNLVVFMVTIYVAVTTPIKLSFTINPISSFSTWGVIGVFLIDFIINLLRLQRFRKSSDSIEIEGQRNLHRFLLITDLMAVIPFEIIFPFPGFSLLRLFKIFRLFKIVSTYLQLVLRYRGIFTLIYSSFWLILMINGLACGWHGLQVDQTPVDFITDYTNALYWTVTTITTVGYGDLTPVTNPQKIYAICVQLFGYGVFTFMIGAVASRLMQRDPARARYEDSIDSLASLMHYRNISPDLSSRIIKFYRFMWKKRLGYDETYFLQSLPEGLRTEVALCLKHDVINKVPIFKDASDALKREIALLLRPIFLTPDDYIFKAGDIGEQMFFVVGGELVTLTADEERELTLLKPGDYFGEIALFKNENRSATIKALSYCDVYSLDKKSFDNVINKYPEIRNKIRATVEERVSRYSND